MAGCDEEVGIGIEAANPVAVADRALEADRGGRARQRVEQKQFQGTDEAIAMAVMYTANHMDVKAIVALTESGSTPLWMSRMRSVQSAR